MIVICFIHIYKLLLNIYL